MSTVKTTNLQHPSAASPAIVLDADGNMTPAKGYLYQQTVYFTSNGSFTKATYPWLRAIRVRLVGGGGGGGSAATTTSGQNAVGGSGSGACYAESFITDIAGLSASVTVTVGSGGTGGAAGLGGSAGGASSFGALVSADGGAPGVHGVAVTAGSSTGAFQPPVAGATTGTGDLVIAGGASQGSIYYTANAPLVGTPGDSMLSRSQYATWSSANGNTGQNYGGGGSGAGNGAGAATAKTGGAGAPGIVIVELYA